MRNKKGQEEKNKFKTLKEINISLKFPLWLRRYFDNGKITRYQLINSDKNNYWIKDFNTKEEVLNYFNSYSQSEVTSQEANKKRTTVRG